MFKINKNKFWYDCLSFHSVYINQVVEIWHHLLQCTSQCLALGAMLLSVDIRNPLYSMLPISRGHFSPNNSWKTPIPPLWGWAMGIFCELALWPKFYNCICCVVGNNVYIVCTAIYREFIVLLVLVNLDVFTVSTGILIELVMNVFYCLFMLQYY